MTGRLRNARAAGAQVLAVPSFELGVGLALALLGVAGCGAPAAQAPGATTLAPAGAQAAPAVVSAASDWNAPPTNGSPGMDVPKLSGHDLIKNVSFDGGKYIPWTTSFTVPGDGRSFIKDGQFCTVVTNKGKDPWDAQARHREMVIEKGHPYSLAFTAPPPQPIKVKGKVGMSGPPYKEYWADTMDLQTRPQTFVGTFNMDADDDPTAELA